MNHAYIHAVVPISLNRGADSDRSRSSESIAHALRAPRSLLTGNDRAAASSAHSAIVEQAFLDWCADEQLSLETLATDAPHIRDRAPTALNLLGGLVEYLLAVLALDHAEGTEHLAEVTHELLQGSAQSLRAADTAIARVVVHLIEDRLGATMDGRAPDIDAHEPSQRSIRIRVPHSTNTWIETNNNRDSAGPPKELFRTSPASAFPCASCSRTDVRRFIGDALLAVCAECIAEAARALLKGDSSEGSCTAGRPPGPCLACGTRTLSLRMAATGHGKALCGACIAAFVGVGCDTLPAPRFLNLQGQPKMRIEEQTLTPDRIRRLLDQAWEQCVGEYSAGRINVECTLQALLYGELRSGLRSLGDPNNFVICEPQFTLSDPQSGRSQLVVPDLVVIRGNEIAAVIEVKFTPWGFVRYEDDLLKFELLAHASRTSEPQVFNDILLDGATGRTLDRNLMLASNCVLAFGAVANKESAGLQFNSLVERRSSDLVDRFHALLHPVG